MKEDVVNVVFDTQKGLRGLVYQYAPPLVHQYFPMQETLYFMVPHQYAVYGAKPYAYPSNYPPW